MSELQERMPHITAFPEALGTGIIVRSAQPIGTTLKCDLQSFIDEYGITLSRFRADSLVGRMATAGRGGSFDFPDWSLPLFELYDALDSASRGAIDPCVGEDLIRLGYGADLTFTVERDAREHTGSIHGRPTWRGDVERHGTTLVTHRAVHLDFGACGKGYLVDVLARRLRTIISGEWLIDAGGDMAINIPDAARPVSIGLEDPADTASAIGIAHMSNGSFCASAPSRRHWGAAYKLHHLLNAIDGQPAHGVSAAWVAVPAPDTVAGRPAATPKNGDAIEATRSMIAVDSGSDDHDYAVTATTAESADTVTAGPGGITATADATEAVTTAGPADTTAAPAASGSARSSMTDLMPDSAPGLAPDPPAPEPACTPGITTFATCPTAVADGLATALFVTEPDRLAQYFSFSCALLDAGRHAMMSEKFPGRFFVA
ncbi:FAD:protein FMN transferase [Bifidobacterium thermophilum]|uniref:FAD:protein FMN transferase n=1 Tax=Bifidobacterium thermophilum TaxID=33905 RepID=UPI0030A901B1